MSILRPKHWNSIIRNKHNQKKEIYDENLELFKAKIMKHFNDAELLENLLYRTAKNLFKLF